MIGEDGIENVVLAYLKYIASEDDFRVRFWSQIKLRGILLTDKTETRKASVFQHGISDQIVVYLGFSKDFDYETCEPKEKARRLVFDFDCAYDAAKTIIDHLRD